MAVTTKKTFPATTNATTTVFSPVSIQLNNQDDLDVYVTLSGGTRVLQLRQSTGSTAQSSHPQVNNTDGLYFPAVSAGTTLYNYTLSSDNNTITFNSALPSGAVVFCERRTRDADSAYTSFASGSTIRATDLNNSSTESNFTAQDARNKALDLEGSIFGGVQPSIDGVAQPFVNSSKIIDGSIATADIADGAITPAKIQGGAIETSKIANGNITENKIANDAVNSQHYVDGSIDTQHIADAQITTAKIADSNVTTAKITDSNVTTAKIADANVTTAKIANDAVNGTKIADDSINSEHYVDGSIDTAHIADSQVTTAKIADANVTTAKIASNAVTTDKIADSELSTLAGMQSGTASKLAGSTALTADIADLNQIDGMQKATTITDDDTKFPTSGAIVDYVAAQLEPFGGFEAIANESSFPNTQPVSGVCVSIADAGGMVVSSSGTASGATVGGTTVNISGIASNFRGTTINTGVRFIVVSTGSGQNYTYHKATLKEDDLANLSGDINDFSERYRVGSSNPTTSLDNGDLFFNTGTGKMLVYNGTNTAWEEVQSVGNFFINTLSTFSGTGGNSATPNGTAYKFTLSNAGLNAEQHIVSVDGVIQKPNSGTSQPSEGFAIDGATIVFGSAPANGASIFVITIGSTVNIGTPSNNTVTTAILQNGSVTTAKITDANVTTAKIQDGAITNAKVNASAAIAGTKISPDFGSQNINTTGQISIGGTLPTLNFIDSDNNSDFMIKNQNGILEFRDTTNGASRVQIASNGTIDFNGNVDCNSGLDVTGDITVTGTVDGVDIAALNTTVGNITTDVVSDTSPQLGGDLDTNSFEILLDDDHKIKFGASSYYEIYHDSSSNYGIIRNTANGTIIQSAIFKVKNAGGTKDMIIANTNGDVELYWNNSKKLETANHGIDVIGLLQVNGNVAPNANNTHDLGTTSEKWAEVHATTYYGDGSNLTGISGTTINSNADNRIITGSGTANTLNGESSLTFDGNVLEHTGSYFRITGNDTNASNALNFIQFNAGKCEYHSDQNANMGSSGHLFTTDGTYAVKINASGIYPASNATFDLGSSSLRWNNIYTNDLNLSNEGHSNDVDGTWGNWTIQEGESDLFLKNNRSGKKYKFNLTEVS